MFYSMLYSILYSAKDVMQTFFFHFLFVDYSLLTGNAYYVCINIETIIYLKIPEDPIRTCWVTQHNFQCTVHK